MTVVILLKDKKEVIEDVYAMDDHNGYITITSFWWKRGEQGRRVKSHRFKIEDTLDIQVYL